MSRNEARIHGLLRKSLVGELLDTQFDLFSARSKCAGNITKPQALFANHEALAASSEYFASLLSRKFLNDPTLIEFQDYHTCEGGISLSEYGYASNSDLNEEEEEIDEIDKDKEKCVEISTERMSRTASNLDLAIKGTQCIMLSHRVLVTDTAFNIWQALLYYLYTDEIVFAPLQSQGSKIARHSSLDGPPPCSLKSMYRLACKIKHDKLQAKALAAIRSSWTEHNILIDTTTAMTNFPTIAGVDLLHEVDV
ncbi:uncharacterized protein F5147DRAFT_778969 [Suillus discolor]|uniref:BTB domain-containing protein n=1 Tax=Suillus discolor TaxID=1912936 RepID=A0A9P7EW80_9AGAM|nr:uncharacterized protein F5147DRAFT_778969 [Suillus discolor]KAG2094662.1 hypothetical protein F5147DRAFT_778969 [Suillus discolor]